jgi:predicted nucleic acid-binding protein
VIFWDSSALVKAYLTPEPGHARALNLLLSQQPQGASLLVWPEAAAAVARRAGRDVRLRDSILGEMKGHLEGMNLVPLQPPQMDLAVALIRTHPLRGADAVHLSTALLLAREVGRLRFRFVTADTEQAAVARSERLRVIEPA